MKYLFLDVLRRLRARGDFTGEDLLRTIEAAGHGQRYPESGLRAGTLKLDLFDPGNDVARVDYCGVTADALCAISAWEPDQDGWACPSDAYVLALRVPLDASKEGHIVTLLDWSVRRDRLASDVWSQLHRVEGAGPVLNGVLCKVVDAAVEAARLAVVACINGQTQGKPPPVVPVLSDEVRAALTERARPQAPIVKTPWFIDGEYWTSPALGGTVVVVDPKTSNDQPHFMMEGPVTLDQRDLPASFGRVARDLMFQPVEPEDAVAFVARYYAGFGASDKAKRRTRKALVGWLDVCQPRTWRPPK